MIASLPMYDRPETAAANDRFWAAIRSHLGFGPQILDRDLAGMPVWTHCDLLLSQTCGLPYRQHLIDRVLIVGTPDYGLPDAKPGYYYSVLIVTAGNSDKLAKYNGKSLAISSTQSQSGWAAPLVHAANQGIRFGNIVESGSHSNSAQLVASGKADIAAVDAQTWRMISMFDTLADGLKVIGKTDPTPGLPMITSLDQDVGKIAEAVKASIAEMSDEDRQLLNLRALITIPSGDYLSVPTPPNS